jgi:peptide/nickel transport system substrate-binding protein/oligopeptide transport system substrate-binding protein
MFPASRRAPWLAFLASLQILALMALAGCQSSPPRNQTGPAPDAEQILRVPLLTSQPLTLDPALINDSASAAVAALIYPSLMTLDATMVAHPWAAESVDISADGLSLTFHLRGAIRFSDGEAITAQTFAYSLNRALDPCTGAPDITPLLILADAAAFHQQRCINALADQISGPIMTLIGAGNTIEVVDPATLTLRLERPWIGALAALAAPVAYAVPPALAQSDGTQWTTRLTDNGGVGGSLFRLTGVSGGGTSGPDAIQLTRNPQFWGTAAKLREIDFSTYAAITTEWADYQAGKLDLGYPPPGSAQAAGVQAQPLLSLTYLGLNQNAIPLDNLGLRQALALAINKRALAAGTLSEQTTPTNHLMPEGEPGYNPSLIGPDQTQNLTGNTSQAVNLAQMFASSRCDGQFSHCPELKLEVASEDSSGQALAAAIARMWQVVAPGYPLQVSPEPRATLEARIASGAAQLYLDTWRAEYADPSAWLDAAFGPNAPGNGAATTPDVQTLLAQGEAERDPAQRTKDYQAAEQLLVSDVAWIPLVQWQALWQVRATVSGVALDAWGGLAVYDTAPEIVIIRTSASG